MMCETGWLQGWWILSSTWKQVERGWGEMVKVRNAAREISWGQVMQDLVGFSFLS